jgi:hypothetical protein
MSHFEYYNDLDSHFKELLIFSSSFFVNVYIQNFVHSVYKFKYTLCIVRIYTLCIVCYYIRVRKIESAQSIRIKG